MLTLQSKPIYGPQVITSCFSLLPDPLTQMAAAGRETGCLRSSGIIVHVSPFRQTCSGGKAWPFLLSVKSSSLMLGGQFNVKNSYNTASQQDIL
jgi:hypothetical protein